MPSTIGYSFGDIVLVPFPFTDQSISKRRPAIVVSSDAYHRDRPDLIVIAVSSQGRPLREVGEASIAEWEAAGLLKPSVIKPLLATLRRDLAIRKLGTLAQADLQALRKVLHMILGH
jgi:mRNA interferase MazF